jgi:hypothetical protein
MAMESMLYKNGWESKRATEKVIALLDKELLDRRKGLAFEGECGEIYFRGTISEAVRRMKVLREEIVESYMGKPFLPELDALWYSYCEKIAYLYLGKTFGELVGSYERVFNSDLENDIMYMMRFDPRLTEYLKIVDLGKELSLRSNIKKLILEEPGVEALVETGLLTHPKYASLVELVKSRNARLEELRRKEKREVEDLWRRYEEDCSDSERDLNLIEPMINDIWEELEKKEVHIRKARHDAREYYSRKREEVDWKYSLHEMLEEIR